MRTCACNLANFSWFIIVSFICKTEGCQWYCGVRNEVTAKWVSGVRPEWHIQRTNFSLTRKKLQYTHAAITKTSKLSSCSISNTLNKSENEYFIGGGAAASKEQKIGAGCQACWARATTWLKQLKSGNVSCYTRTIILPDAYYSAALQSLKHKTMNKQMFLVHKEKR